jgi:hypothetical protein
MTAIYDTRAVATTHEARTPDVRGFGIANAIGPPRTRRNRAVPPR